MVLVWNTYVYDGVLALDPRHQLLLLDVHNQVPALEVTRHGDVDVEVADGLGPLVREGSLLLGLLGACRCILLGGGI
jgi:hypothetical protein